MSFEVLRVLEMFFNGWLYRLPPGAHISPMAILKIARMGHPVLRRKADPVPDPTAPEIHRLIADMAETLEDIGGAGLAAPQVHVPLRVVIFQVPQHRLTGKPDDQAQALTAIINPVIEPLGTEMELGWEGCLSVPGLKGAVPRYARLRYHGFAPDGSIIDRSVEGFHARVVQHEFDHLDGILYPQRMTDMRLLMFVEEGMRFPVELPTAPALTK
jgi:peptide deformylase